tara:strand:+ start:12256 stop:12426 length:171 start_codon:yes stop_codon:yes gene_type:complete
MDKAKSWRIIALLFVITALILAVIGFVLDDKLFYIRTGIFLIGALVSWVLSKRKKK